MKSLYILNAIIVTEFDHPLQALPDRDVVGENTILHQKIFFLHQTGHDGLSRFCTKIS